MSRRSSRRSGAMSRATGPRRRSRTSSCAASSATGAAAATRSSTGYLKGVSVAARADPSFVYGNVENILKLKVM